MTSFSSAVYTAGISTSEVTHNYTLIWVRGSPQKTASVPVTELCPVTFSCFAGSYPSGFVRRTAMANEDTIITICK